MKLGGLRILLAEDNATNQMVAMQMLQSLGAEDTLAADGAEALDALEREPFDVGLIDIEMPRVSGTEVIRRVRAGPGPAREMPLIALTAYVMREHRAAIDEAGADGVIAKPILSIEQLGEDILAFAAPRFHGAGQATAPAAPAPAEGGEDEGPPAIDRQVCEALLDSVAPGTRVELLARIEEDLLAAREEVTRGRAARDPLPLRRGSHVIVSVAGAIGANALQLLADRLNSAAHGGDPGDMDTDAAAILDELDRVVEFVRERRQA